MPVARQTAPLLPTDNAGDRQGRATDKGVILLPLCTEGGMYVMDNRWIYIFFLHHVFHIIVKFPLSSISLIRCNRESRRSTNVAHQRAARCRRTDTIA